MSNPILNENMFNKADRYSSTETMTVNGAIMKAFILALVFSVAAIFTYSYLKANTIGYNVPVTQFIIIPSIAALIVSIIISFKPTTAPFLSVVYSVLEAVALASISFLFNAVYEGIVFEAIACTMIVFFTMLFLFRTGIIQVTAKFRAIMFTAISSVAIFYILMMVLSLFGIRPDWYYGSSLISIGISVVIIGIAAFSLILDFDFFVEGENSGLPKYMEWYAAFGLMVTILWLYLEILKLLAKLKDSE